MSFSNVMVDCPLRREFATGNCFASDICIPTFEHQPISESDEMQNILTQHITKTLGVCGGMACIVGHRIRVMDIVVWHEQRGYSPDEIVGMFPGVSLANVYAALAFYFDNRTEIMEDFRRDDELAMKLKPLFPSKLREKLRG